MSAVSELAALLRSDVAAFNAHLAGMPAGDRVDLRGADLRRHRLTRCEHRSADLTGADLTGCRAEGSTLSRCRLQGVRWGGLVVDDYWRVILGQIEILWRGAKAWNAHRLTASSNSGRSRPQRRRTGRSRLNRLGPEPGPSRPSRSTHESTQECRT